MVKILMVCTSASELKGHETGLWMEECAGPYYIFEEAGYDITIASPQGGPIPLDEKSLTEYFFTDASKKFLHDHKALAKLTHSVKLDTVDMDNVDAIFLSAGIAVVVDYVDCPPLKAAIEGLYADGKPVVAVCHAPVALVQCITKDGKPLVEGKKVAGFTNAEEVESGMEHAVPFLLETKLKELGADYEKTDNWGNKVCVDGNLITGQNPMSSEHAAKEMVKMLAK